MARLTTCGLTGGNAMWPRYTRWDVVVLPAAEGPVTVTLQAGAATDAYGHGNNAPGSALSVIAADPVMVEVTRTTSGFAEGGKAAFIVTRSRDNGAIPVSLSLDQTGDLLSGTVEVYPPPDPNMPENPVTPTEVEFTETPFTLNVTFAAGETSKRIALPTEDDYRDEDDGTVTLSVPAKADQYKYIPGLASSASAAVRDNDVPATVSLYWIRSFHPYTHSNLDTELEGGSISLVVYGRATGQPLQVTLAVTEVGSYLDLDGERARGYENLGNGKLRVTLPVDLSFQNVSIPLVGKRRKGGRRFRYDHHRAGPREELHGQRTIWRDHRPRQGQRYPSHGVHFRAGQHHRGRTVDLHAYAHLGPGAGPRGTIRKRRAGADR